MVWVALPIRELTGSYQLIQTSQVRFAKTCEVWMKLATSLAGYYFT